MGRRLGTARTTPAELARRMLCDLEDALQPRLEDDWTGSDTLRALRLCREQLVEALCPAVWRSIKSSGSGSTRERTASNVQPEGPGMALAAPSGHERDETEARHVPADVVGLAGE